MILKTKKTLNDSRIVIIIKVRKPMRLIGLQPATSLQDAQTSTRRC